MSAPEIPQGPPLEASVVASLSDGTPIIVIWSGGNGPHRYTVQRLSDGTPVAATEWEVAHGRLDIEKALVGPLGFVGTATFHTRVWLEEARHAS